jgi:maltose-binding protein MalE
MGLFIDSKIKKEDFSMSRNLRKILSTLLAAAIVLTMAIGFAGCGAKSETGESTGATVTEPAASESAEATEPAPKPAEPVEIAYWEQDDPGTVDPIWDEIAAGLTAQYPNITVTRTHLETEQLRTNFQTTVAAGEGPQILSGPDDNIGVFATAKTAMELDNFVSGELLSSLDPKALEGAKMDGKLYGIPYRFGNALCLLYNKKMVQTPPQTMDELIAMAKDLTKGDTYGLVYNMNEPFFFIPFLGGFGGKVFDDAGNITLNTDPMKKALQFAYDLKFTNKIIPKEANYDVASNLFKEGKAAMLINGPWSFKEYKDAGIDLGIAKIPQLPGGTWAAPYTSNKVLIVSANVTDDNMKDAVNKFIEFINTKDNQLKLAKVASEIPTNLEAQKDPYVTDSPDMKAFYEQMSVGTPMPIVPKMRAIWDGFRPSLEGVMGGKMKVDEAAAAAQKKAEDLATEMLGQ